MEDKLKKALDRIKLTSQLAHKKPTDIFNESKENKELFADILTEDMSPNSKVQVKQIIKNILNESLTIDTYTTALLPMITNMWNALIVPHAIRTQVTDKTSFVIPYQQFYLEKIEGGVKKKFLLPQAFDKLVKQNGRNIYFEIDNIKKDKFIQVKPTDWLLEGTNTKITFTDRDFFKKLDDVSVIIESGLNGNYKIHEHGLRIDDSYLLNIEKIENTTNQIVKAGSISLKINHQEKSIVGIAHLVESTLNLKIKITATVSAEENNEATPFNITFETKNKTVNIEKSLPLNATIPAEFVSKLGNLYETNALNSLANAGREVFTQVINYEFIEFLKKSVNGDPNAVKVNNLSLAVPSSYSDDPVQYRSSRIKDAIEEVVSLIKKRHFVRRGHFTIIANPTITRFIQGVNWHLIDTYEKDVVDTDYTVGTFRGSGTFKVISSEQVPVDEGIFITFQPSNPEEYTLGYYNYLMDIDRTTSNPLYPNVPNIRMTKMDSFINIVNATGQIKIDLAGSGYPFYV